MQEIVSSIEEGIQNVPRDAAEEITVETARILSKARPSKINQTTRERELVEL